MSQSRNGRAPPHDARAPSAPQPGAAPRRPGHRSKSRNRNKIPKNMQYDLENALLGLCDVWFEEIKPHLVRNNIKLHVDAREDSEEEGAGAGDRRRACAHVDPASSAPSCGLCRLLSNAANSIESAVSQAAGTSCEAPAVAAANS